MAATEVKRTETYRAKITVDRSGVKTINKNGRGYEADNFEQKYEEQLLHLVVTAKSTSHLRQKVSAIMNTLDMPEEPEAEY